MGRRLGAFGRDLLGPGRTAWPYYERSNSLALLEGTWLSPFLETECSVRSDARSPEAPSVLAPFVVRPPNVAFLLLGYSVQA